MSGFQPYKIIIHIKIDWRSPHGNVADMIDCKFGVSEFKFQSRSLLE